MGKKYIAKLTPKPEGFCWGRMSKWEVDIKRTKENDGLRGAFGKMREISEQITVKENRKL
jgi:hypothetical protein